MEGTKFGNGWLSPGLFDTNKTIRTRYTWNIFHTLSRKIFVRWEGYGCSCQKIDGTKADIAQNFVLANYNPSLFT